MPSTPHSLPGRTLGPTDTVGLAGLIAALLISVASWAVLIALVIAVIR